MNGDGCGKSEYPSESRARQVARKRMRDNHTVILRPYRCKACGMWHLTSKPDKFRRRPED